jgi:hypothetical protein
MINLGNKAFVIAIALIALFGVLTEARAYPDCTNKCATGYDSCMDWCAGHNSTQKSLSKCEGQCWNYWRNGKNPQSIGPANPTTHPSGPAQVNPLPKGQ